MMNVGFTFFLLGLLAATLVWIAVVDIRTYTISDRLNLGIALLESKQFADAETNLREALKRNNNVPTGHMYLGIALLRLNRFDEAEKELVVATESSGKQLGLASYYLGGLYWRKQDYPRAVEQLETYLRLTPNAPDAERVRATIKDLRGRTHTNQ